MQQHYPFVPHIRIELCLQMHALRIQTFTAAQQPCHNDAADMMVQIASATTAASGGLIFSSHSMIDKA